MINTIEFHQVFKSKKIQKSTFYSEVVIGDCFYFSVKWEAKLSRKKIRSHEQHRNVSRYHDIPSMTVIIN